MRRGSRRLAPVLLAAGLLGFSAPARSEEISASEIRVGKGETRTGDVVLLGKEIFLEGELGGSARARRRRRGGRVGPHSQRSRPPRILGHDPPGRPHRRRRPLDRRLSHLRRKSPGLFGPAFRRAGRRIRRWAGASGRSPPSRPPSRRSSRRRRPRRLPQWPFLLSFRLALLAAWLVVSLLLLLLAPRAVGAAADSMMGRGAFLGALGATAVLTAAFAGRALALSSAFARRPRHGRRPSRPPRRRERSAGSRRSSSRSAGA